MEQASARAAVVGRRDRTDRITLPGSIAAPDRGFGGHRLTKP